ncbi:MAG: hypothetical protein IJV40_14185 [Oscillospiraceae bacterium]|nr:hypothetical protein [Oscillospiraceae bacterium]
MNNTSALYNSIISGSHSFEVKVAIASAEYGMDTLTALRTSRAAFGSGSPRLGLAAAGEISLSLFASSADIPRMAQLRPYVRCTDGTRYSEWIPKGVYYVDTREADTASGILTLRGYDAMLKGEQNYPSTSHSWPASDINVVNECAAVLGVSVDARTTALMTAGFSVPLPASLTVRETLQYIAALYGGSFVITDEGALRLVCLWDLSSSADLTVTGSNHRLVTSPAFPACTGVRFLLDNEQEVFAGSATGYVYELSCPFATQAAANRLLSLMQGFVYRPYTAEAAVVDPAAEIGDTVSVSGGLSGLFSCDLSFDSLCAATLSAPEDEELDHEYPYTSPQERSFSRRLQNVQSELTLQAQAIAAKVSRTGGDASSFGWYLDADKFQLLADNAVVMLVNRDGLSVQGVVNATAGNIGGCSIANGVLKIANANIESLNAGKITAGTLSVDRIASKSLEGSKIADYTLSSTKIDDGAAVNRVIGSSAVSYAKTSFQSTLDQVGTNKANIDAINGYFTGSANFNALSALSFALNYHYLALEQITIGGVNRKVVTWT